MRSAVGTPALLSPDRPLPAAKRVRASCRRPTEKRKFVQSLHPTTLSFEARLAPKLAKKFPHLYSCDVEQGNRDVVQDNEGVVAVPASKSDDGSDAVQVIGANVLTAASQS